MQSTLTSNSPAQTKAIAAEFAQSLPSTSPVLVLLEGEFGVGKTQFVQGLGKALGISEIITSPSYVYMQEYVAKGGRGLIHFDLWRVRNAETLELLQIQQYLTNSNIVICEWGKEYRAYLLEVGQSSKAKIFEAQFIELSDTDRKISFQELSS